ncbi:MAG: DNA-binding protein [Oscillospiraceae bacterium]|nr:DNA-binding protein [Oscillospiraceae bacterium]
MSVKNFVVSGLLDFYGRMLTPKQYEAARCYYDEDLSLSEIAINQKITRQGVRDAIKRAEVWLFRMEEKLEFFKKSQENKKRVETIRKKAERINFINKTLSFSKEIQNCVQDIEEAVDRLLTY